ncbi:MAG TPA: type II secretion system secretin GspD [Nevskiaceae bacterium]|nr:type II secretion system secretin GspD [Nevskiaceae bacterium]
MSLPSLRALRLLPAALALLVATGAGAATATLNLKDADINTLITMVSEITGKNFIVDNRVKGKVTVISAKPMTPGGVYETFLGVLEVNGFAAVPDGQSIKIVPEANARTDGGVFSGNGAGMPIDDLVTHVYTLENVSATQLVPILRQLMPQWAHLAAYQPSNQLILADRAANVQRIERLIKQMDQASDRDIDLVKLQNASASEVVRTLTSLQQADKTTDPSSRPGVILADERSNSVLVGGDKGERAKLLDIIARLDQPLKDDGATQVIYLHYASAENLAPILQGYAQQANSVKPGGSSGATAAAAAPVVSSGGGNSEVHVIADKDTNALIITASPKVMRQVRDVIAQLDIRRSQVLVEAIIAEVSATKTSNLGVDWAVFNPDRVAMASVESSNLSGLLSSAGSLASTTTTAVSSSSGIGAALGLLGQGATIGGGRISNNGQSGTSFAVLLHALQGDGDTNILSTPTLVTLDNQEAKFSAGQEVPFQTGSFTTNTTTGSATGLTGNPFSTFERKDVGLTLGVTPQINEGGTIKLKLDLEVSSVASGTIGTANVTTTKRKLTNTVGVDDGQVLVIGGLIDDQYTDTTSGIPLLDRLPFIGGLFSSRAVNKIKRNLMVFIKPSILRKEIDGDYYTRRKYEAVRQAQIDASVGSSSAVGGSRPLLENLEDYKAVAAPKPAVEPQVAPAPGAASPAPAPKPVPNADGPVLPPPDVPPLNPSEPEVPAPTQTPVPP